MTNKSRLTAILAVAAVFLMIAGAMLPAVATTADNDSAANTSQTYADYADGSGFPAIYGNEEYASFWEALKADNDLKDMVSILESMLNYIPFVGMDNNRFNDLKEEFSNLSNNKVAETADMVKFVAAYLMTNGSFNVEDQVINTKTDINSGEKFILDGNVSFTGEGQVVVHAGGIIVISHNYAISSTSNLNDFILEKGAIIAVSADATAEDGYALLDEVTLNVSNKFVMSSKVEGDKSINEMYVTGHITFNDELEIYGSDKPILKSEITGNIDDNIFQKVLDLLTQGDIKGAISLLAQGIKFTAKADTNITSLTIKSVELTIANIVGTSNVKIDGSVDMNYDIKGEVDLGVDGSTVKPKLSGSGSFKISADNYKAFIENFDPENPFTWIAPFEANTKADVEEFELKNTDTSIKFKKMHEENSMSSNLNGNIKAISDMKIKFSEKVDFGGVVINGKGFTAEAGKIYSNTDLKMNEDSKFFNLTSDTVFDPIKMTIDTEKEKVKMELTGVEVKANVYFDDKETKLVVKQNENFVNVGKLYLSYNDNNYFEMKNLYAGVSGSVAAVEVIDFIAWLINPEGEMPQLPTMNIHVEAGVESVKFKVTDDSIEFTFETKNVVFDSTGIDVTKGKLTFKQSSYEIGSFFMEAKGFDKDKKVVMDIGLKMENAKVFHDGTIDIGGRALDAKYTNNIDYFKLWVDESYIEMKNSKTVYEVDGTKADGNLKVSITDTIGDMKAFVQYREKSYISVDMKNSTHYYLFNYNREELVELYDLYEQGDYVAFALLAISGFDNDKSYIGSDDFKVGFKSGVGKMDADIKNFKIQFLSQFTSIPNYKLQISGDMDINAYPSYGTYENIKLNGKELKAMLIISEEGLNPVFSGKEMNFTFKEYKGGDGVFKAKDFEMTSSTDDIFAANFVKGTYEIRNFYMSDLFGYNLIDGTTTIIFGEDTTVTFDKAYMEGALAIKTSKVSGTLYLPAEVASRVTAGSNIDLSFGSDGSDADWFGYFLCLNFGKDATVGTLIPAYNYGLLALLPYPDGSDSIPYTLKDVKAGDITYTEATLSGLNGLIVAKIDKTKCDVFEFQLGNEKRNYVFGDEIVISTPDANTFAYIEGFLYKNGEKFYMVPYNVTATYVTADGEPIVENGKITTKSTGMIATADTIGQVEGDRVSFETKNAIITLSKNDIASGVILDVQAFDKDTKITAAQVEAFGNVSNLVRVISIGAYVDSEDELVYIGENLYGGAWIRIDNIAVPDGFNAEKDLVVSYIDENGRAAYLDDSITVTPSSDGKTCSVVFYSDHLCDYGVSFEKEASGSGNNTTLIIVLVVVVIVLILAIAGFAVYKKKNA